MSSKDPITFAPSPKSQVTRDADVLRRVVEFAAAADELLDEDIEQPTEGELDARRGLRLVRSVTDLAVAALREGTSDSPGVADLTELGLLGADLDGALRQLGYAGVRLRWRVLSRRLRGCAVFRLTTTTSSALGNLKLVIDTADLAGEELLVLAGDNLFELGLPRFGDVVAGQSPSPRAPCRCTTSATSSFATHYGIATTDGEKARIVEFAENHEPDHVDARPRRWILPPAGQSTSRSSTRTSQTGRRPDNAGSFLLARSPERGAPSTAPVSPAGTTSGAIRSCSRPTSGFAARRACRSTRHTASTNRNGLGTRPAYVGRCSSFSCRSAASSARREGPLCAACRDDLRGSSRGSAPAAAPRRLAGRPLPRVRGEEVRVRNRARRSRIRTRRAASSTAGERGLQRLRARAAADRRRTSPATRISTHSHYVPATKPRPPARTHHNQAEHLARELAQASKLPVPSHSSNASRAGRPRGTTASRAPQHLPQQLPRRRHRAAPRHPRRQHVHDRNNHVRRIHDPWRSRRAPRRGR